MKRLVTEQRLGFVATVCPDGTPNLSPKGTTAISPPLAGTKRNRPLPAARLTPCIEARSTGQVCLWFADAGSQRATPRALERKAEDPHANGPYGHPPTVKTG